MALTDFDKDKHSKIQRTTPIDKYIGLRLKELRTMLGVSQQQLGALIDVSYQQIHKYEHGSNRISAGRLFDISKAIGVPPLWFFEGFNKENKIKKVSQRQRMAMELVRNFSLIDNDKHQEALSSMARAMAGISGKRETS